MTRPLIERLDMYSRSLSRQGSGLVREAITAIETLEWFAEHAYSLKDRERAQKALEA